VQKRRTSRHCHPCEFAAGPKKKLHAFRKTQTKTVLKPNSNDRRRDYGSARIARPARCRVVDGEIWHFDAEELGIRTPELKQFAREVKRQAADRHLLAAQLWRQVITTPARCLSDRRSKKVTVKQMDAWAADFDNWSTVDGTCCSLFCQTPFAYEKAVVGPRRSRNS